MSKKGFLRAVKATGDKVAIPVGVAAAGGVAANQFPQNQKSSDKTKKKVEHVFKSDNEFATRMYNLVMKMDEDEARIFTSLVVGDVLEDTIEKNLRTLQRHLNHVVTKRTERIKKALLSSVSKGADEKALAYAQALSLIEKAVQWDADEHPRAGTGRFTTKVHVNHQATPLSRKQEQGLQIPDPESKGYRLGDSRGQYQQEYQQISQFLDSVYSNGKGGDHHVTMHVENKFNGRRHKVDVTGKPTAARTGAGTWDPKTERVVGLEARPSGLTLGEASFGLTNSLGRPIGATTEGVLNRTEQNFDEFSADWTRDVDQNSSNARLYNNLTAGSKFVRQVAPWGSHAQIAAKFGEFVGSHGPEAEKVFGPYARRTAYRYRGTEKTPDADVLRDYEIATQRANAPTASMEDARKRTTAFNRAITRAVKEKAAKTNTPEDAVTLTRQERAQVMAGVSSPKGEAPVKLSEEARGAGREVLARHLWDEERRPKKDLYGLHLDAGNTPPSEGFIIDKNGKVTAQAIGYGDDHYLPFNLKNLKNLDGGEYIRTRSVGGPTSEDIYTGLVSGAQKITVISRSGTFTIDFEDDFRGGRRYNDKASRMVGRYQRLLDSVQSEQVDKEPVSPEVRAAIVRDVRQKSEGYPASDIKAEITRRLNEYKENPDLSGPDETAIQRYLDARTAGMSDSESRRVRGQLLEQAAAEKEFKFRLNGEGYGAALKALQEQFPYYLKADFKPTRELERHEVSEHDEGYVEPGFNRPTKANGTWHGTKTNQGGAYQGHVSASHMDFQRGKYGVKNAVRIGQKTPVAAEKPADASTPQTNGNNKASVAAAVANQLAQRSMVDTAVEIAAVMRPLYRDADPKTKEKLKVFGMDEIELREHLKDPKNVKAFDEMYEAEDGFRDYIPTELRVKYQEATNRIGRQPYNPATALLKNNKPPLFPDEPAYQAGASPGVVDAEKRRLGQFHAVSNNKPLTELTDPEINTELDALTGLKAAADQVTPEHDMSDKDMLLSTNGVPLNAASRRLLTSKTEFERHLKSLSQVRALNLNRGKEIAAAEPAEPEEPEPAQPVAEQREGVNVRVAHVAPRRNGDAEDHREKVRGLRDRLIRYARSLERRKMSIPAHLENAILDANTTLDAKGPIQQSHYLDLVNSDDYQASEKDLYDDMNGPGSGRDNW